MRLDTNIKLLALRFFGCQLHHGLLQFPEEVELVLEVAIEAFAKAHLLSVS